MPRTFEKDGKKYVVKRFFENATEHLRERFIFPEDTDTKDRSAFQFHNMLLELERKLFFNSKKLKRINFTKNSELKEKGSFAFSNTAIESLTIPSSVTELKYNWSHMTPYLIKIDVMPGNKRYKMHKHDFLIGKTDPEIDKFYDLLFAR